MKKITIIKFCILSITWIALPSCNSDFLNKKPDSKIVTLSSIEDYESLLENTRICNITTGLPQVSSDEYFLLNQETLNSLFDVTERNAYTWESDIYEGTVPIKDWSNLYEGVLYANSVLSGLKKTKWTNVKKAEYLRGRALFIRAHHHFNLLLTFAPAYDPNSSDVDLGIPIRLSEDVTMLEKRWTVSDCYAQIISDLEEALPLLPHDVPPTHRYRPSQTAVMGLLARIYLNRREYNIAEKYADMCLESHNTLLDYNDVNETDFIPFSFDTEEVIYHTRQIDHYSTTTGQRLSRGRYYGVDTNLLDLYDENDLRLSIFYAETDLGHYVPKVGYVGQVSRPFTGIATDEIYLIKAECAARRNKSEIALEYLNRLLEKRYRKGTFTPIKNKDNLLSNIKRERRKELVWRGLRWFDIIRYNKEGANITLKRDIGGKLYELPPNSPRYVFPIPDDEINFGGLTQNPR